MAISEKWDIIERRINVLCKEGRIHGAYKENKRWIIPSDEVKPADKRLKGEVCISRSEKKVVAKSDKKLPGILIELKAEKICSEGRLDDLAERMVFI